MMYSTTYKHLYVYRTCIFVVVTWLAMLIFFKKLILLSMYKSTTYFHKKASVLLLPIATTLVFFSILSLKRDAKVTLKLPLHWVYQVVGLLWKPNEPTCIIL